MGTGRLAFAMVCCLIAVGCGRANSPDGTSSPSGQVRALVTGEADLDCDRFRKTIPADWFQGIVRVPENPADTSSPTIRVFYYGKINANSIPTVYFNGGPNASSHGDFSVLTQRQRLFDPQHGISMIFIDQRGNGCSDPYPQGGSAAILARLSYYGSRGIVADAEAVRAIVWPGKKWIAAGQSYGGYIVHRYVTLHPEALTAAISQQDVLTSDGYTRLKNRYASQAQVMTDYLSQYPDDQARLTNLRNYLTLSLCGQNTNGTEEVCGFAILQPFTNLLGFTDTWLQIHDWLGIMAPGNSVSDAGILRFLNTYVFSSAVNPNQKGWAAAVIDYTDRNLPTGSVCAQARNDLLPTGVDLASILLSECMATLQKSTQVTNNPPTWTAGLTLDPLTIANMKQVLQSSALPLYLYSSAKDPYVPPTEFTEELTAITSLSNVHYTEFQDTGHDGSYDEPQTWADWITLSSASPR